MSENSLDCLERSLSDLQSALDTTNVVIQGFKGTVTGIKAQLNILYSSQGSGETIELLHAQKDSDSIQGDLSSEDSPIIIKDNKQANPTTASEEKGNHKYPKEGINWDLHIARILNTGPKTTGQIIESLMADAILADADPAEAIKKVHNCRSAIKYMADKGKIVKTVDKHGAPWKLPK